MNTNVYEALALISGGNSIAKTATSMGVLPHAIRTRLRAAEEYHNVGQLYDGLGELTPAGHQVANAWRAFKRLDNPFDTFVIVATYARGLVISCVEAETEAMAKAVAITRMIANGDEPPVDLVAMRADAQTGKAIRLSIGYNIGHRVTDI